MKTNLTRTLAVVVSLGFALPVAPVLAQDNAPVNAPVNAADLDLNAKFMANASQANWTEIKLGKEAQSRTKRGDVKAYADEIVRAHESAQDSLKKIMKAGDVDLPKDDRADQQSAVDDLKRTNDADFDRMFVKRMIVDHQANIAAYEAFIAATKSAELKNYATITLDHLKTHLTKAEALATAVGGVALDDKK